ncbi:OmpA family protein [Leadbetterella byssophila]|jgi:chemotaxis protein MotB|uniref:OmpA/MotB domain protein n=1 Tax=Leadbetterella byssophila (strain DSM 17132 / JCM 16389 / KACC 11308 / NBRC 106382 / 4M15) TaxID=649349 RepID=E4RTJ3_LEAB4|nr:OmpA family protein [Leadbetterella byssophila]ADQ16850.1 OmpA/MotB domain protein [Leadbetterella byssophila DSM 17132]
MGISKKLIYTLLVGLAFTSCVSKKKFASLQSELASTKADLERRGELVNDFKNKLVACEQERDRVATTNSAKDNQISDLKSQIEDLRRVRDTQMERVGDLTVLNRSANENINKTLAQLEKKDKYISLLQAAKSKADSLNLALAVNLKSALKDGLDDTDVDVKVDKTVVMVNLSDKMLFTSGSYKISPRAYSVLEKVAAIIKSRPDLEVMVEGYTDNVSINTACIEDNWDLSVKRSTSVVRTLQSKFGVDPNKIIAAGRGEYNTLTSNSTAEGRAINRRTRIILMPKLDQFYDLLNPDNVGK